MGTSLFIQSVVKHILTQGDTILIAVLASLQAQGTYFLASNYGALAARMLFQPIEESSRNYFAKLLSAIDTKPSRDRVQSASQHLHTLLRGYMLMSLFTVVIGPTIAPLLLKLVAGPRWTSTGAGDVLAIYCYYIPFLAINGVTEAFISAVASKSELNRQSAWMLAFSVGFAVAGYIFLSVLDMGAKGLVWANISNMAIRILWSTRFIAEYLGRSGSHLRLSEILPQPASIAVGLGTVAVLPQLQQKAIDGLLDLIKIGFATGIFIILL